VATQYALMKPGSLKNWSVSSASLETIDRLSFENPVASGIGSFVAASQKFKLLRTASSGNRSQTISQPNVIEISKFDALNPWNKVRDVVASWADLKADWDDEGAVVPRPDGLKFLEMMIARFKDEGSPKAMPYIAGDGEFGLHWRLPGGKAVLSILADGRVLAFCPKRSGDPIRIRSTLAQPSDMQAFYKALREIAQ
jgi:hypothetical protein